MEKLTWKERYDRMKAHEGLIDSQIAEICGYASRESLVRSLRSAKVFPLKGMVWIWEKKMGLTDVLPDSLPMNNPYFDSVE